MALENQLKIPRDAHVLALCAVGSVRSLELKYVLNQHGYTNVDFGGVAPGIIRKRATKQMFELADVIITVDPDVKRLLLEQYTPHTRQALVGLEVYDGFDPVTRQTPDLPDIGRQLEEQISPYLSD